MPSRAHPEQVRPSGCVCQPWKSPPVVFDAERDSHSPNKRSRGNRQKPYGTPVGDPGTRQTEVRQMVPAGRKPAMRASHRPTDARHSAGPGASLTTARSTSGTGNGAGASTAGPTSHQLIGRHRSHQGSHQGPAQATIGRPLRVTPSARPSIDGGRQSQDIPQRLAGNAPAEDDEQSDSSSQRVRRNSS